MYLVFLKNIKGNISLFTFINNLKLLYCIGDKKDLLYKCNVKINNKQILNIDFILNNDILNKEMILNSLSNHELEIFFIKNKFNE